MDLPYGVTRVQSSDLPSTWSQCATKRYCVYNVGGLCDDPRNNKGNSDAACHTESNRSLLSRLQPAQSATGSPR